MMSFRAYSECNIHTAVLQSSLSLNAYKLHYKSFEHNHLYYDINLSLNNVQDCNYALALSESNDFFLSAGSSVLRYELYLDSMGSRRFTSVAGAYNQISNLISGHADSESSKHKLFIHFPSMQNGVLGMLGYTGIINIDLYQGNNIGELVYVKTFEAPIDVDVYPYVDFGLDGQFTNGVLDLTLLPYSSVTKNLSLRIDYNTPFAIKMLSENNMLLKDDHDNFVEYKLYLDGQEVFLTDSESVVYRLSNVGSATTMYIPIDLEFPQTSNHISGNYQDVIHYVFTYD